MYTSVGSLFLSAVFSAFVVLSNGDKPLGASSCEAYSVKPKAFRAIVIYSS